MRDRPQLPLHHLNLLSISGYLLLPVLLIAALPVPSTADIQPQTLFNRGNYLMEEQNYPEALEIFREIESHGYRSGPLFYNMGISYVYLDSLGKAAYYFCKSAQYRETGSLADAGLDYIEEQKRNLGTFIPYLSWYAFIDWFLFDMNHVKWIWSGIILLNIGILVLIAGWLIRPNRRIAGSGITLAVTGLLLIILTLSIYIRAGNYNRAVIVEPRVYLHPEPGYTLSDEEMNADPAYEAYIVTMDIKKSDNFSEWAYIRLRNGVKGWVPESALRVL